MATNLSVHPQSAAASAFRVKASHSFPFAFSSPLFYGILYRDWTCRHMVFSFYKFMSVTGMGPAVSHDTLSSFLRPDAGAVLPQRLVMKRVVFDSGTCCILRREVGICSRRHSYARCVGRITQRCTVEFLPFSIPIRVLILSVAPSRVSLWVYGVPKYLYTSSVALLFLQFCETSLLSYHRGSVLDALTPQACLKSISRTSEENETQSSLRATWSGQ
jgi:hypothetical protein